jgi:hypothetical protein
MLKLDGRFGTSEGIASGLPKRVQYDCPASAGNGGGSYLKVGIESRDFKINPFTLSLSKRNLDLLTILRSGSRRIPGRGRQRPPKT